MSDEVRVFLWRGSKNISKGTFSASFSVRHRYDNIADGGLIEYEMVLERTATGAFTVVDLQPPL